MNLWVLYKEQFSRIKSLLFLILLNANCLENNILLNNISFISISALKFDSGLLLLSFRAIILSPFGAIIFFASLPLHSALVIIRFIFCTFMKQKYIVML